MFKNVAAKIELYAFNATTGVPVTGDAANITAYVSKDYGACTVLGDITATEKDAVNAKGWYLFDTTAAEANADALLFTGKSATANIVIVGRNVYTRPVNFSTLNINAAGSVGIQNRVKSGQVLTSFPFTMTDSTNHNPTAGATVTATRSIDGGTAAAGTLSAVTDLGGGRYAINFATGDTTGAFVTLILTATGFDTQHIYIPLSPA